jgi:hypothetical protein
MILYFALSTLLIINKLNKCPALQTGLFYLEPSVLVPRMALRGNSVEYSTQTAKQIICKKKTSDFLILGTQRSYY